MLTLTLGQGLELCLRGGNTLKISEFAKKAGITVKTLLHYDKVGILKPSNKNENGYRIYSDDDFLT